ncbi:MAG: beta-ketoacyl-[acyl-carrier-protein] synthase family protein [bacterium]|nr:beta-ketoacyl-[acyl-carrier-protein] synthase family protein [bacterium]
MGADNLNNRASGRVVITDAAAVTALGNNLESLWQGLMAGKTAIRPITRFPVDQDHYHAKIAAHIDDLISSGDRSMLQDLLGRLLLGMGPVPSDAALITATIKSGADNLESFCRGKPVGFQDVLLSSMADIAGTELNLSCNGICVSASCASSTIAVAHGAGLIESGRAEAALVCCGDLITEYHFSGFSALKALSPFPCRPFDRDRKGLSLGEGAAALLLMNAARARRENRNQLGTILGWGISNDATHITAPAKSGRGLVQAVDQALRAAKRKPEEITAISAHGTGTVYNDLMEINAFRQVFGKRKVPIYSIKGAIGHTLGAAGGLEIILAFKALSVGMVPPTVGFSDPEKGAEGQVSPGSQTVSGDYLLTTNSGFGGVNAALVLGK